MFESHLKPPISFPTLTGSIVTFNAQYALPLKSHTVEVVASQSGTGIPSPLNPRSISGWNGQNIYHSGADTSNPTVYYVAFGSTIYGGYRDARTGVLTVTHKGVDLGSLTWTYRPSGLISVPAFISNRISDYKEGSEVAMCSCFEIVSYRGLITDNYQIGVSNLTNATDVVIRYDEITTSQDLTTALSGQYMVYELATPITIQLPPCPIDTLQGVNNIFADTGDTTLQYPKFG